MRIQSVALAAAFALVGGAALAETIEVQMLNRGEQGVMVFEPAFVQAQPGDVIHFVPTDPGHNAETIKDMWPAGVAEVKGVMGKEVVVKFAKTGVYGFKCMPHWTMGMTFVAKVGDGKPNAADAEAAIAKAPPLAKKRLTAEFAAIK
jgi:pseudoazurin